MGLRTETSRLGRGGSLSRGGGSFPVLEAADLTARLSLTELPVSQVVHQVDTDTRYQYNGPGPTTQAAVFVVGGDNQGTYTPRGTHNARLYYTLLGESDSFVTYAIFWTGSEWRITDPSGVVLYHSISNVATPDLAVWLGLDDLPAEIVVESISAGELRAGLDLVGDPVVDGIYSRRGIAGVGYYYNIVGLPDDANYSAIVVHPDGGLTWRVLTAAGDNRDQGVPLHALPWSPDSVWPDKVLTRNDIACSTNWSAV